MAYADFLTALMAFFLLLWLVSGVSPETRAQLADYFHDGETVSGVTMVSIRQTETEQLYNLLANNSALQAAGKSVFMAQEADGVRIDLVDSDRNPLFATDSGAFTASGMALTQSVGETLRGTTAPLTIEGHTDAFAAAGPYRTNWDISSERANTARRALVGAGITPDRIRAVSGLADTRPLNPGQPHLSENRRVSILLHVDG